MFLTVSSCTCLNQQRLNIQDDTTKVVFSSHFDGDIFYYKVFGK